MNWFIYAFISMAFLVVSSVLKKVSLKKNHTIHYLLVFYIFNAILVLPLISKVNFNLEAFEWFLILLVGTLAVFAIFFMTRSMKYLELSFHRPLTSFSPLIVFLLGFIFLKESVSLSQFAGLILILALSFILIKEEAQILHKTFNKLMHSRYVKIIFAGLFLGAINIVLDRIILRTVDPVTFMFMSRFVLLIGFTILALVHFKGWKEFKGSFSKASWLILILAILNIGIIYFYNSALADPAAKASLVAAIRYSSMIFTIILAGSVLKEKGIMKKVMISLVLLIGYYLIIR